jgi:predicted RNA-binding Zn-ribbon protein involved in translation (DUF1610 family)
VIFFGRKSKARHVPDGRFEKRRCPECGKTAVFREVLVEHQYHVYFVINLFDTKTTKFSCDRCGSVMSLDDTLDPELTEAERAQAEALAKKEAALEAKRRALEDKKARAREAEKAKSIEDELAEMKKRLGLD